MFITLGILIISIAIALIELPKLKKGGAKLAGLFLFLLVLGAVLNIAISLNVSMISPLDPIIYIFQPISDFLMENLLNKK